MSPVDPHDPFNTPNFVATLTGNGPGTNEARRVELTPLEIKIIMESLDMAIAMIPQPPPDEETKAVMFKIFASGYVAGMNFGARYWLGRIKASNEGLKN